jgi:hypothetical protein
VERAGDLAAIAEAESTRACAAREAFRQFAEQRTGTSRLLTPAEARRRALLLSEIEDAENRLAEAVLEAVETFHQYRAERGRPPMQKGARSNAR